LGNGTFNNDVVDVSLIVVALSFGVESMLEPPVIVRIVPWVGKVLDCYGGSWICGGGGGRGLASIST
jgi:hypothetical protein